jgi:hypothetical protein
LNIGDIITFLCELLPFITGMAILSSLPKPYRILLCQSTLVFCLDLYGFYLRKSSTHTNNQWLYNYYQLADCGLLLLAGYYFDRNNTFRIFAIGGFITFLSFWLYAVYQNGIGIFAVSAYNILSILLIAAYFWIFYRIAMNNHNQLLRLPELWLCLGIIAFYGCNMFFFSIAGDLQKDLSREELGTITYLITTVLNNVRYLFTALSFYLVYINRGTLISKPHVR